MAHPLLWLLMFSVCVVSASDDADSERNQSYLDSVLGAFGQDGGLNLQGVLNWAIGNTAHSYATALPVVQRTVIQKS